MINTESLELFFEKEKKILLYNFVFSNDKLKIMQNKMIQIENKLNLFFNEIKNLEKEEILIKQKINYLDDKIEFYLFNNLFIELCLVVKIREYLCLYIILLKKKLLIDEKILLEKQKKFILNTINLHKQVKEFKMKINKILIDLKKKSDDNNGLTQDERNEKIKEFIEYDKEYKVFFNEYDNLKKEEDKIQIEKDFNEKIKNDYNIKFNLFNEKKEEVIKNISILRTKMEKQPFKFDNLSKEAITNYQKEIIEIKFNIYEILLVIKKNNVSIN